MAEISTNGRCPRLAYSSEQAVMRAERCWKKKIPELERYSRAFRLNSPQNAVLSPRNCAGFDVVVSAIRDSGPGGLVSA